MPFCLMYPESARRVAWEAKKACIFFKWGDKAMKIQCQACQAEFNVDAAKIPEAGVKAACKKCGAPIFVTREGTGSPEEPAPAGPVDLSAQEARLGELLAADDQDGAADLFLEMIKTCARGGEFEKAEQLHNRMYDETPMALNTIIAAGEAIEELKSGSIDPEHLERWDGIYGGLTQEEITTLSFAFKEVAYPAETVVFKQGDVDGRLFLVEAGELKMVCPNPEEDEEDITIQEVKAGDIFGADHFFYFSVCTYTAVVVEDCRLKCLDKSFRFKWLEEQPKLEHGLQSFCNTRKKASELIVEQNIERRRGESRASQVKATIGLIDTADAAEEWSRGTRFTEVSPGGACLELKLNKQVEAEALLGKDLQLSFKLEVGGVEKPVKITARVVAINFMSFGGCEMHIQFTKPLSEKALALF
jgi:predicted Zn finger-like uncharacterized protein